MLEDVYSVYLPKKAHPWCYISLNINPQNIDVNVHPTKHEVRFLHEDTIVERIKFALDERLTGNSASRTFYLQARLPKADITKEVLEEVLPEYNKGNSDKLKKIHAREMIRTDSSDQKLDKFNFTIHFEQRKSDSNTLTKELTHNDPKSLNSESLGESVPNVIMKNPSADNKCQEKDSNLNIAEHNSTLLPIEKTLTDNSLTRNLDWSDILDTKSSLDSQNTCDPYNSAQQDKLENVRSENLTFDISEFLRDSDEEVDDPKDKPVDAIADRARKQVYQYFGNRDIIENIKKNSEKEKEQTLNTNDNQKEGESSICNVSQSEKSSAETNTSADESSKFTQQFKSYSVNNFKHEVKLTSILKLRKDVEDECHEGLRDILVNLTFVGCIDQTSALIQSGVNLYICNTRKLT